MNLPENIVNEIKNKIISMEKKYHIIVLFWCIQGSRGCGREHKNSDYDIGCIYIDPKGIYRCIQDDEWTEFMGINLKDYLDLQQKHGKTFNKERTRVLWEDDFDIKVKSLDYRSIYHWMESPYIFHKTNFLIENKVKFLKIFYNKDVLNYYIVRIQGNYKKILSEEYPLIEIYLRIIHGILSSEWILKNNIPAPMHFTQLIGMIKESYILKKVQYLLQVHYDYKVKRIYQELELNQYIEKRIEHIVCEYNKLAFNNNIQFEIYEEIYASAKKVELM